jgi:hypothetical protein
MPDRNEDLWRGLHAELDRVEPPWSSPRYLTAKSRPTGWMFAPAALGVAAGAMVALTVYAGSPNPVVWTQHVVTVVHPAQASPTPTPSAVPSPTPAQHVSNPTPSEPPEQHESPEPTDGHSGSNSGTSGDHQTSD